MRLPRISMHQVDLRQSANRITSAVIGGMVDGLFSGIDRLARLAPRMPEVRVVVTDWHLSVMIGERLRGFTVGPYFLSYDVDNDIARQLFFSRRQHDMDLRSNVSLEWSSHTGIIHLHIPHVHIHEGQMMPESGDDAKDTAPEAHLDAERRAAHERPTMAPPRGDEGRDGENPCPEDGAPCGSAAPCGSPSTGDGNPLRGSIFEPFPAERGSN